MGKPSLFRQAPPSRQTAGARVGGEVAESALPSEWVMGRVTEVLGDGWVEVEVPADDPQVVATGPSDGTVTQVGAVVRVLRSPSGRVQQISGPTTVDSSEGAQPVVATGGAGQIMQSARAAAREAQEVAAQVKGRAEQAASDAAAALSTSSSALTVAESNRPPVVGVDAPPDPVDGQLWYPTNESGQIVGARVWSAAESAWVDRPLVADSVLVPSSVGAVSLSDGAVTAPKMYASEEMWAKLAAFGSVTTDMLVAGNATIPGQLVVGDLSGNNLVGGSLSLFDSEEVTYSYAFPVNTTSGWATGSVNRLSASQSGLLVSTPAGAALAITDYVRRVGEVGPPLGGGSEITLKIEAERSGWPSGAATFLTVLYRKPGSTTAFSASSGTSDMVTLPDGARITGIGIQSQGMRNTKVTTSTLIKSITLTWRSALSSGLRIYRDSSGLAKIDIATNSGVATFTSEGVSYFANGAPVGTVPWATFVAPPIAVADWTLDQTIAHGTWTNKGFSGAGVSLYGGFAWNATGSKVIVPVSGFYRINGRVRFENSGGSNSVVGKRVVGISINSATTPNAETGVMATAGAQAIEVNSMVRLAAGDTIQLMCYQNSGGSIHATSAQFSAQYVALV